MSLRKMRLKLAGALAKKNFSFPAEKEESASKMKALLKKILQRRPPLRGLAEWVRPKGRLVPAGSIALRIKELGEIEDAVVRAAGTLYFARSFNNTLSRDVSYIGGFFQETPTGRLLSAELSKKGYKTLLIRGKTPVLEASKKWPTDFSGRERNIIIGRFYNGRFYFGHSEYDEDYFRILLPATERSEQKMKEVREEWQRKELEKARRQE